MRTVISIYPARRSHGRAGGVEGISKKQRIELYRRNIEAISGEFISIIKLKMAKKGTWLYGLIQWLLMSLAENFKTHIMFYLI